MTGEAVSIGLDFGTSGLKAVATRSNGVVVARTQHPYATARPDKDAAEQDPADWLRACDSALAVLGQTVDPSRWAVIGLSAMLPTLISLDAEQVARWPAITWEDARAEAEGDEFRRSAGDASLYRRTGQRVDGRYLLPMHMRRKRENPDVRWAVGAKDYLFFRLTGVLATDPSTAAGYAAYDLRSGAWDAGLLAIAGDPGVPEIVPASEARPLLPEFAARWGCEAGLPVVVGAADSVLGAYGLGIDGSGQIACIAGTSTVFLGWSETPAVDPAARFLVTPLATDAFGLEMDLLATGSSLTWLAGLFGLTGVEELAGLAAGVELTQAPLVLPYLAPGEQGALWDSSLIGSAEGLRLTTTRGELARGLIAGIVAESMRCVNALTEVTGARSGPIVLSGSGGRSGVFRQDLADATGIDVWFDPTENDHSVLGAARFAGQTVLGWSGSGRDTSNAGTIVTRPDPGQADTWNRRFHAHEMARAAQHARLG